MKRDQQMNNGDPEPGRPLEPATRRPLPERLGLTSWMALASSLVAVAAGIAGLLFLLFPGLRPGNGSDKSVSVGNATSSLKVIKLDLDVTQKQYFKRLGIPANFCTHTQLSRRGVVVYVAIRAPLGSNLQWHTYDASRSRRLPYLGGRSPIHPSTHEIDQVWVPTPQYPRVGAYFVRFELYTNRTLEIEPVDTTQFTVEVSPFEYRGPPCQTHRRR